MKIFWRNTEIDMAKLGPADALKKIRKLHKKKVVVFTTNVAFPNVEGILKRIYPDGKIGIDSTDHESGFTSVCLSPEQILIIKLA